MEAVAPRSSSALADVIGGLLSRHPWIQTEPTDRHYIDALHRSLEGAIQNVKSSYSVLVIWEMNGHWNFTVEAFQSEADAREHAASTTGKSGQRTRHGGAAHYVLMIENCESCRGNISHKEALREQIESIFAPALSFDDAAAAHAVLKATCVGVMRANENASRYVVIGARRDTHLPNSKYETNQLFANSEEHASLFARDLRSQGWRTWTVHVRIQDS